MLLRYLEELGPSEELNLRLFSQLLVVLLALCSPKRVSELAALSLEEVTRKNEVWNFALKRTKNRRWGKAHSAVYYRFSENGNLCPVLHLEEYVERTKELRKDSRLLCACWAPYNPVTAANGC